MIFCSIRQLSQFDTSNEPSTPNKIVLPRKMTSRAFSTLTVSAQHDSATFAVRYVRQPSTAPVRMTSTERVLSTVLVSAPPSQRKVTPGVSITNGALNSSRVRRIQVAPGVFRQVVRSRNSGVGVGCSVGKGTIVGVLVNTNVGTTDDGGVRPGVGVSVPAREGEDVGDIVGVAVFVEVLVEVGVEVHVSMVAVAGTGRQAAIPAKSTLKTQNRTRVVIAKIRRRSLNLNAMHHHAPAQ